MARPDPLGEAMLDHQRGERGGRLRYRDGGRTAVHDVGETYFTPPAGLADDVVAWLDRLEGPVLDVGCGPGKYARWFQRRGRRVVGVDVSRDAVRAARGRGVAEAAVADMFALPFRPDCFGSAVVVGTQLGLARSLAGVRSFLADLARVTDAGGRAVVDNYDPAADDSDGLLGYRPDIRPGLAFRAFHFEYARPDGTRVVGPTLAFLLFGPDRLAEAAAGTPWRVVDRLQRDDSYYQALLEKPSEGG